MTAAELHALVQHWPEEAMPKGLSFVGGFWLPNHIPDNHAIALHVASGLEWLAKRLEGLRLFPSGATRDSWYIDDNIMPPQMMVREPTLLQAISAAITATRGVL